MAQALLLVVTIEREPRRGGSMTGSRHQRSPRAWRLHLPLALLGATLIFGVVVIGSDAQSGRTPWMLEMKKVDPDDGTAPTVFPHWKHQRRFRCFNCHPGVFSTTERAEITHKAMNKGRFCGACHDDNTAFAHNSKTVECEVCHAASD
jgi:c(7)-type cytochrome triheme protein